MLLAMLDASDNVDLFPLSDDCDDAMPLLCAGCREVGSTPLENDSIINVDAATHGQQDQVASQVNLLSST